MNKVGFIWGLTLLSLTACNERGEDASAVLQADMVLSGGPVHVMDLERTVAQAVALKDGIIIYVGDEVGVAPFIGSSTQRIDLAGRPVFPGFTDAHVHIPSGGETLSILTLYDATTPQQAQEMVRVYAANHPELDVIVGTGWELGTFPGANPHKSLIDAVVPDRPVILEAADGHNAWVNSKALELAGITKATPDPVNGRIERDAESGEPSGTLRESAKDLVAQLIPKPTLETMKDHLRDGAAYLNALGYTAAIEAASNPGVFEQAYAALAQAGTLNLKVALSMVPGRELLDTTVTMETLAPTLDALKARRASIAALGVGNLNADAVKIFVDGVPENYTAALLEPYVGSPLGPDHKGEPNMPDEVLNAYVAALDEAGFQVHFHALGDRAVRMALNAVEGAYEDGQKAPEPHHISHLEILDPADYTRFNDLGVYANVQALWAYADEYITELTAPFMGAERASRLYPIGSLVEAGAPLAMGSDWPVSIPDPFAAIEVAVRRQDWQTLGDTPWLPEQAVTLDEMLDALTIGGAALMGQSAMRGTVTTGKDADLVILDRDPYQVPVEDLSEITVDMTLLKGAVVYRKPAS